MEKYDLIVIGTGNAGTDVALKCSKRGMNVAIVDSRDYGGTCAQRGCVPKKVITGTAGIIDDYNRMIGKGMPDGEKKLDWKSLIKFKKTFTENVSESKEKTYKDTGIDTYHGNASFYTEDTITVGDKKLGFEKLLIASGAKPRELEIPGKELIITSEEFMALEELPETIVFVGGGYISFEFSHAAARAGSKCAILHRGKQPLEGFDPDLVTELVKCTKDAGIDIHLDTDVVSVEKQTGKYKIKAKNSAQKLFYADLVVHGAGRVPNTADLDLKRGNIEARNGAVAVNQYMQSTSNQRVYAAGDCTEDGLALTPVAHQQARIASHNILNENTKKIDYSGVPSVVFTLPPLAMVGIDGSSLKENYSVIYNDRNDWYSTKRLNHKYAASKIIVDNDTDQILGAHILGPNAEEAINIFALAVRLGFTREELYDMIYSYPSVCSDIRYMI